MIYHGRTGRIDIPTLPYKERNTAQITTYLLQSLNKVNES